jgi:hypothetical protein
MLAADLSQKEAEMGRRSVQTMQKRLREQRNRRNAEAKRAERAERRKNKGKGGFVDVEDPAAMFGLDVPAADAEPEAG